MVRERSGLFAASPDLASCHSCRLSIDWAGVSRFGTGLGGSAGANEPGRDRPCAGLYHTPGSPDILLNLMAVVLVGAVLAVGVMFFWLHSLPERLVHNSTKMHLDLVALLALLSLFTHIHAFWVAALLLAFVKVPDFSFFGRRLQSITNSLERIADGATRDEPYRPAGPRQERKPH